MARKTDVEKLQAKIKADLEKLERAKLEQSPELEPVRIAVEQIRKDKNAAKVELSKVEGRRASKEAWLAEIDAGEHYYRLAETNADDAISALTEITVDCDDIQGEVNRILAEDASGLNEARNDFISAREYRKSLTAERIKEVSAD